MKHAGGDDRVWAVATAQQLGDLERMQDERPAVGFAPLPAMVLDREVERPAW